MRTALVVILLGLAACQGDDDTTPAGTADTGPSLCDDAPVVTWENFGSGFTTESCQACHASTATDRQGAPEAVVFDTEEDALALADRILDRVVDTSDMPPQGGVTEDDRYLVEVWLSCP